MRHMFISACLGLCPALAGAQEASPIQLSQYIESLRAEFITLGESGGADRLPLYISPIEVELSATVAREGDAGIKFYVVDAGGSLSSANTQRLKFTVSVGDPGQPWSLTMSNPFGPTSAPDLGSMLMRLPAGAVGSSGSPG